MYKKKIALGVLLLVFLTSAVIHADKDEIPIISPEKVKKDNYQRLENRLVYAGNNLVITVKRMKPADEKKFLKLRSGEVHNYLLNEKAKKKFQLYLLKFVNHSDKKLVFNPGFASLNTGDDRIANKDYTDVYRFLKEKRSKALEELKTNFNEYYYDIPETVKPGKSTVKMLIFEAFEKGEIDDFKLELSWLYLGEDTFQLYFPFNVEYVEP